MALCLLEWMADSLCLAMLLRLKGRRSGLLRTAVAGIFAVAVARALRACALPGGAAAVLWLPAACVSSGLAGGGFALSAGLLLIACEGLLGGTVAALAGALGSLPAAWALGLCFTAAAARRAALERRMAACVHRVRIRITLAGRSTAFDAIVDSGNTLRDYLTHKPVIVLPEAARARLGLESAALRPIFADTAGGRQMMACITLDAVQIIAGDRNFAAQACAAFSPGLGRHAPALVPQALMAGPDG